MQYKQFDFLENLKMSDNSNTQSEPQMDRKEEETKNGSEQEKTSAEEEEIGKFLSYTDDLNFLSI